MVSIQCVEIWTEVTFAVHYTSTNSRITEKFLSHSKRHLGGKYVNIRRDESILVSVKLNFSLFAHTNRNSFVQ